MILLQLFLPYILRSMCHLMMAICEALHIMGTVAPLGHLCTNATPSMFSRPLRNALKRVVEGHLRRTSICGPDCAEAAVVPPARLMIFISERTTVPARSQVVTKPHAATRLRQGVREESSCWPLTQSVWRGAPLAGYWKGGHARAYVAE